MPALIRSDDIPAETASLLGLLADIDCPRKQTRWVGDANNKKE